MRNPWIKKNPLMSMWLSGANAVAGAVRGRAIAEGKRQVSIMMKKGAKQTAAFWSGAPTPPAKKKKRKSR